jgi:hypothetical protein
MSRSLVLAFTLLLAASAHADSPKRIEVPRAPKTPNVDGVVSGPEWAKAARVYLGDGGHALLQHNGTYLFIAFVGKRAGIGSVCTSSKDAKVRVLHASAALGTAEWAKQDAKWQMARGFTMTNRDTGKSAAAQAERKQFLAKEGWFANTSVAGQAQREYQIRLDGRREIPLVLSFMSWITKKQYDLDVWPDTVFDGCAELDLAGGYTETEYAFEPESWGVAALQ